MRFAKTQRGMTGASMMMIGVLVGVWVLVLIKLYPAYYGDFAVKTSLENVTEDAAAKSMSPKAITSSLMRRLSINNIEGFKEDNVKVTKKDNGKIAITINYEVRTSLFGNLDAVSTFSHSAEIDTQ